MTLLIELAVNMKKINSLTIISEKLTELVNKYKASLSYSNHEIEGIGHKILKHYFIYTLQFEKINDIDYKNLLKDIKKIKYIYIEKIYEDKIEKD